MKNFRERIERAPSAGLAALTLLLLLALWPLGHWYFLPNLRIPLGIGLGFYLALCLIHKQIYARPILTGILESRRFPWMLALWAGMIFVKIKFLQFDAGQISGMDFSHIDYAVWSTTLGRFMEIPVIPVQSTFTDFFGNHYSPVLFIHVLARVLWDSPLASLAVHALSLAAAIPVLHKLALVYVNKISASLLTLSYVFCGSLASTLQFDLHMESFFPLAFGMILLGLHRQKIYLWLGWPLALSIKEDAGIYLFGVFLVLAVLHREGKPLRLALAIASLAISVITIKLLMPLHQPPQTGAPYYLPMWAKYGSTFSGVIQGFLRHPHWVLQDIVFNKDLYKNLMPWAFLPLATPMGAIALVPIAVSSTAAGVQRGFGLYYGIVLVPCFFYAAAYFLRNFRWRHRAVLLSLFLSVFVGGGYLKFSRPLAEIDSIKEQGKRLALMVGDKKFFVQSGLLPFLPYQTNWMRLDAFEQIPEEGEAYVVLVPGLSQDGLAGTQVQLQEKLSGAGFSLVRKDGNFFVWGRAQ